MRRTQIVSLAALAFVGIVVVILGTNSSNPSYAPNPGISNTSASSASKPSTVEATQSTPPEPPKPAIPPASGQTLHPYELLKNPFKLKGRLVLLDLRSRPVLYDGSVIQYSGEIDPNVGKRFGLMALRLNRMMAEDQALYDIMGVEAGNSEGQMLGQILVSLPPNVTELDLGRVWAVEPQGSVEGTNAFGATISIPLVRFWRYQTREQGMGPSLNQALPQEPRERTRTRQQTQPQTQGGGVIGTFQPSSPQ